MPLLELSLPQLVGGAAAALQLLIVAGVILRVVLTRHPPGSAFAWILLTTLVPYFGFFLYLLMGERPIGRLRARRLRKSVEEWGKIARHDLLPFGPLPESWEKRLPFLRLATRLAGLPIVSGSTLQLLATADDTLSQLERDIASAETSIDMEFYIWSPEGRIVAVTDALMHAARRGVAVRILVDDFGSRAFLRSEACRAMRSAGIEIASALPMKFFSALGLQRADLRLHRKTVVIDDAVAYTGSFNMIDPQSYDAAATVGPWVDAMIRITGPGVKPLSSVLDFDWALQPDGDPSDFVSDYLQKRIPNTGSADMIVVPSGPYQAGDRNLFLVIEAINQAQHALTITTPYFIPNEAVVTALLNAALRGVKVTLIIPERCDGALTTWAARRYFDDLLLGGIRILLHRNGLLHTKSIAVDGEFAVFGTLNIDNRSMHLNFELMSVILDPHFVGRLELLHRRYEEESSAIDAAAWRRRPLSVRLREGFSYLLSPLL